MEVNEDAVRIAYKLFLNRNASPEEATSMAKNQETLAELRNVFLNSREFGVKFDAHRSKGAHNPARDCAIVHLHVPKTAGSSLTRVLAPHYAQGTQFSVSDGNLSKLKNTSKEERQAISFMFGHLSHGVADQLPQNHMYVCVLRRPGPRLMSYYNYLYRTKDHPSYGIIKGQDMSFGTFLEWSADPKNGHRREVDNGQVQRLAGLEAHHKGAGKAEMLTQALSHILAPDMMYGLTEHFDDFVGRLYAQGVIPNKVAIRENAAPNTASLDKVLTELTGAQRELYDSFIYWDDILYNTCEQLYFAAAKGPARKNIAR